VQRASTTARRNDRFLHFLHIFFTFFPLVFSHSSFLGVFLFSFLFFLFFLNAVVTCVAAARSVYAMNRADTTPNANAPAIGFSCSATGAATTAAATAAATVQSCGDHSYASRLCECAYNYAWSASEQGPSR